MKTIRRITCVVIMLLTFASVANAQFRFGVKAGVAINHLSFSQKALDSDNRYGFTGGVMAEFTMPITGLGCDASVLYANRGFDVDVYDENGELAGSKHKSRNYIDIPVNFKWKISIPVVDKVVAPFLTTGPDFSFLMSKKNIEGAVNSRSFDFSWNVGVGLQILNKVQLAGSYGIPINKSVSGDNGMFSGRNRCWTVTAAYLF